MATQAPSWTWDQFDSYRLDQVTLENYLTKKFGNYKFYIRVVNGDYKFWVPRRLSNREREELRDLRYEGYDDYD